MKHITTQIIISQLLIWVSSISLYITSIPRTSPSYQPPPRKKPVGANTTVNIVGTPHRANTLLGRNRWTLVRLYDSYRLLDHRMDIKALA